MALTYSTTECYYRSRMDQMGNPSPGVREGTFTMLNGVMSVLAVVLAGAAYVRPSWRLAIGILLLGVALGRSWAFIGTHGQARVAALSWLGLPALIAVSGVIFLAGPSIATLSALKTLTAPHCVDHVVSGIPSDRQFDLPVMSPGSSSRLGQSIPREQLDGAYTVSVRDSIQFLAVIRIAYSLNDHQFHFEESADSSCKPITIVSASTVSQGQSAELLISGHRYRLWLDVAPSSGDSRQLVMSIYAA